MLLEYRKTSTKDKIELYLGIETSKFSHLIPQEIYGFETDKNWSFHLLQGQL